MKFTIDSGTLSDAIAAASSSLPMKAPQPILAGMLIEARIGSVTLSSFNLDHSTSRTVPADVDDADMALVSGRLLCLVGSNLPMAAHTTVMASSSEMVISTGRTEFRLPLLHAEDYPQLPSMSDAEVIGTIDRDLLAEAVRVIGNFASTDEALPALGALNVACDDDMTVLRATDRYIASRRRIPWKGSRPATINVAAEDVVSTIKAIAGDHCGDLEILHNTNLFGLRTPTTTVVTRVLAEEFPNIDYVMSANEYHCTATVQTSVLVSMLKRAAAIADDEHGKIVVEVADCSLILSTSAESTSGIVDSVSADQHGPNRRLTVSARRFLSALSAMDDVQVTLAFQSKGHLLTLYPGPITPQPDGRLIPPQTDTVAMLMGIRSVQ